MKVFHCQNCQQTVFFENTNCNNCGHALAFVPDTLELATLDPHEGDHWVSMSPRSKGQHYRLCANYLQHQVCNWAVPADDHETLCVSCRLTRVLPNLDIDGNLEAWRKLETAKRRLLYSLLGTRSPAPPAIALLGLLGMLLGEQAVPLAKRVIHGQEVALFWKTSCAERVTGLPPAPDDQP